MHSRLARILLTTALVTATAGTLAGCTSMSAESSSPDEVTHSAQAATSAQSLNATGASAATATFGQAVSWEGLEFTVSQPTAFTPSKLASYPQGSRRFVTVDISVTNTSDQPLQLMFLLTKATSGGKDAGSVADSDKQIGAPTTAIAPGASLTWKEAYPMNGNDLTLDVSWQPPQEQAKTVTYQLGAYPTPASTATATNTQTATAEQSAQATG